MSPLRRPWPFLIMFLPLFLAAGTVPAAQGTAARRFTAPVVEVHGGLRVAAPATPGKLPRIGLALAGGGAKAAASIGVLRVLKREGFPIAAIAGTSMGSIVGGLAAAGHDPDRIGSIFLENDWNDLFADTPPRTFLTQEQKNAGSRHLFQFSISGGRFIPPAGLSAGQKLANLLASHTLAASFQAGMDFDRLVVPFRAVATDLETGGAVPLRKGLLHDAIRASAAVPVLFPPVEIDGKLLVDGGLSNNLPVDVVRSMGVDLVIAVDASSPLDRKERITSLVDVMGQAISIPVRRETERQASLAEIVIVPDTGDVSFADFTRMEGVIRAGEQAAQAALPRLRALIEQAKRPEGTEERFRITGCSTQGVVTVSGESVCARFREALPPGSAGIDDITNALAAIERFGVFSDVSAELVPEQAGGMALLTVRENPLVGAVTISGMTAVPAEDLRRSLESGRGKPLNAAEAARTLDALLERYRGRGYLLARIDRAGVADDGTLSVAVQEGKVADILLAGQRRTHSSLIRREMRTRAGEPLNFRTLAEDLQHLYGLTYFESINIDARESGDGGVVLTLRVKERHRGTMRLGLRYDTEDAFTGLTDIIVDNLYGRGIKFSLNTRYGNYLDLAMGYHSPVLLNAHFVHAVQAFYRERTYFLYRGGERSGALEVSRTGGDLAFGYQWFRFGDTYLRYRFTSDRSAAVYGTDQPQTPVTAGSMAILSSVDTRDSQLFPHAGVLFRGSYEVARRAYGGETSFRKLTLSGQAAVPFSDRHTVLADLSAGMGSGSLQYQERFGIGGMDHLLGFPLPGYHRREFVGSNELGALLTYRWKLAAYQLKPVRALYLSLSGGAANVWDGGEERSFRRMWTGAGMGLHADTVVGPIRFDLGAGEDRRYLAFLSAGFDF